jgi:hypothetical protein
VLASPRRCARIDKLHFVRYRPSARLDERLRTDPVTCHATTQARQNDQGAVLWNALLRARSGDARVLKRMLELALRHLGGEGAARREPAPIPVDARGLGEGVAALVRETPPDQVLALHSRIVLRGGEVRQLPMMGSVCEPLQGNREAARELVRRLGQPQGAIVRSDHSFHFSSFEAFKSPRPPLPNRSSSLSRRRGRAGRARVAGGPSPGGASQMRAAPQTH